MKKFYFVGLIALIISCFIVPAMACDDCPPPPPPCDDCSHYTGEWSHGGSTYLAEKTEDYRWQGSSGYDGKVEFDVKTRGPVYVETAGNGHSKTEYRPANNPQAPGVELIYTESCGKAFVWKTDNKP